MSETAPAVHTGQITVDTIKGLLAEIAGPEFAAIRAENEKKGQELLNNYGAQLAAARQTLDAPPEKGAAFSRSIQCLAIAKGDKARAMDIAKKRYGKGADGTIAFLEGGTEGADGVTFKALGSNVFVDGGALVRPGQTSDVIELLRPASAVRMLNPTIMPLDTGTLPIPGIAGGATASYAGENQARNATQQTFRDVVLSAKELGCIVPVSTKLLETASVDVDTLIRNDALAAIGQREDLAFMLGDGTQNTPRGMRFWAASGNVVATAFTNSLADITAGVKALLQKLATGNVRMIRPGFILNPNQEIGLKTTLDSLGNYPFRAEMAAGTFWGFPFKSTTQLLDDSGAAKFAFFADFADTVIGQMSTLTVDASNTAAYNDSTGTVVAAFSRNQVVVRLITNHDFGCRHRESIALLTAASWS